MRTQLIALLSMTALACSGSPPAGRAGGDLSGDYPDPTVEGVQGQRFELSGASAGQVLTFSGTDWRAANLPQAAAPPVRVVAAGVFTRDGTPVGPVFGGLVVTVPFDRENPRGFNVTFDGYQIPDQDHTYIVQVQPLIAGNATFSIGTFADSLFAIFVRQLGPQGQLAIQISEIRSQ